MRPIGGRNPRRGSETPEYEGIPFKRRFLKEVMGGVHPTLQIPTKIAVMVGFHLKLTQEVIFWPNIDIKPYL